MTPTPPSGVSLDVLAAAMHVAYEARAEMVGWETQPRSRVPYEALPEANKSAMRAGVLALLEVLTADGWRRVQKAGSDATGGAR